jgi:hypothetical protein
MKEKKEIIRWEVYDRRDRWMGGYSVELDGIHSTSSYEMAMVNAEQCSGKVFAILDNGEKEEYKFQ